MYGRELLIMTTLLACSNDSEEIARGTLDASAGDAGTTVVQDLDAAPRLDAAWPRDGQFLAGDRFCTNWNTEVGRAAIRQLPQPLSSQCAAYGASRPAQPTRGPQFLDAGVFLFEQLADFVSVEQIAPGGYASKYALFCTDCDATYEVYDESLTTVLGRVVPDHGYVAF